MADPLSISASIVAILQLTSTVVQYLNDVKDASKECLKIRDEISSTSFLLYMLKDRAEHAQAGDDSSSTVRSLNVPNGPLNQFKDTLERLTAFLAPVHGLKGIGKAVSWPLKKTEVKDILGKIERQKLLFSLALQNDHVHLSEAIKHDVSNLKGDIRDLFDGVAELQIGHRDGRREKILRWLSAPDASSNHNQACWKRQGTTGSWFVQSKQYAQWKTTPDSVLWLHGIPGCGKTVLSSTIIEDVLHQCQQNPAFAIGYFYFDFNDDKKQRHERMLHSLLKQISVRHASIPRALDSLYSCCAKGERQPTTNELLATLKEVIEGFQETFIILDAMDECKDRQELLQDIQKLGAWKIGKLHILATSRREKEIEDSFESLIKDEGRICIQSALINDDIRAYVHERLLTDQRLKRWRNHPDVREEIETTLMDKADGMFRWAVCQLDALWTCLNLPKLRSALASLPKTLDDTYARILCNIDEEYSQYALKILQWLAYSSRPLRLEEVAEAIAVDVDGEPRFDPERRLPEPQDLLTICSSLVTTATAIWNIDPECHARLHPAQVQYMPISVSLNEIAVVEVRLAHFSVKEYLVSERIRGGPAANYTIQEVRAHESMAEICVAYLLQFDNPDSVIAQNVEEYPLARYAAEYWTDHAHVAEEYHGAPNVLSRELLLSNADAFLNCIKVFNPDTRGRTKASILQPPPSPLYYSILTRLPGSTRMLLEAGSDVNKRGGEFFTPLHLASALRDDQIVQMLLEKGAEIDEFALQVASRMGYEGIVQLLLEYGADVNKQGGVFGTALAAASGHGHEPIVRLLLDKGARVNAFTDMGFPLREASAGGHYQIVQLLLDNSAVVNARTGASLRAASGNGFDEIVRLLLENGAEINLHAEDDGTALYEAACKGHNQIVQRLLKNEADVNLQGGVYGNALQAAAYHGHAQTVQCLVEIGSDVNVLGGVYGTALQAASIGGHLLIVQMLLEEGADVNTQGGHCVNALQGAASGGHENIIRLLLNNGADLDTAREMYGESFEAAAQNGKEAVVQLLKNRGPEIRKVGALMDYQLSLMHLEQRNKKRIMRARADLTQSPAKP